MDKKAATRADVLEHIARTASAFAEEIEEDHPAVDQVRLHRLNQALDALNTPGLPGLYDPIFHAICPFCNGTAVKSGNADVYHIEPPKRITRPVHLPSSGRAIEQPQWVHMVELVGLSSYEQICWANKAREAVHHDD